MRAIVFLLMSALFMGGCRPAAPDEIPLPTKICVKTSHHGQPISMLCSTPEVMREVVLSLFRRAATGSLRLAMTVCTIRTRCMEVCLPTYRWPVGPFLTPYCMYRKNTDADVVA
jgi:hypothetical protein